MFSHAMRGTIVRGELRYAVSQSAQQSALHRPSPRHARLAFDWWLATVGRELKPSGLRRKVSPLYIDFPFSQAYPAANERRDVARRSCYSGRKLLPLAGTKTQASVCALLNASRGY